METKIKNDRTTTPVTAILFLKKRFLTKVPKLSAVREKKSSSEKVSANGFFWFFRLILSQRVFLVSLTSIPRFPLLVANTRIHYRVEHV